MGRACARSSEALRVPDPRRRAGRPKLDYYSEETPELSEGVRSISGGEDRSLRRARYEAVARGRWDRAESIKDRSHHRECEGVRRVAGGNGELRHIPLELRRRQTNPEPLANHG